MAASQLEFIVLMVVLTTTTITTSGFPTVTDQVGPQNHPQVASAVMSQDVPQPAPQVTPISTSTAPLDAQQDVNAAPQVAPSNQLAPEVAPQPSPDVAPSSPVASQVAPLNQTLPQSTPEVAPSSEVASQVAPSNQVTPEVAPQAATEVALLNQTAPQPSPEVAPSSPVASQVAPLNQTLPQSTPEVAPSSEVASQVAPSNQVVSEVAPQATPEVVPSDEVASQVTPSNQVAPQSAPTNQVASEFAPSNHNATQFAPSNQVAQQTAPYVAPLNQVLSQGVPVNQVASQVTPVNQVAPEVAPSNQVAPEVAPSNQVPPSNQVAPEVAPSNQAAPEVAPSNQVAPEDALSNQVAPEVAPSNQVPPEVAPSNEVAPEVAPLNQVPPSNQILPQAVPGVAPQTVPQVIHQIEIQNISRAVLKVPLQNISQVVPIIALQNASQVIPPIALPNASQVVPLPEQAANYQDYELNALNRHNYYRRIHNAPAMQLDKELSRYASTWAAKMAQSGTLTQGYRGDVGSNTKIECDGTQDDGIQVVDSWYKDVCNYNFNTHQPVIGLFSQLVWKSSTSLGIGRSRGNYGGFACTYWVAVYKPPGNYEISREWNVDMGSFDWNAVCNPDSGQTTAPPQVTAAPVPVTSTAATPETAPPTLPATGAPPEVTTTPTPPVTTQKADNYKEYQLNALNRHNYYRRIHNAPAMQLDKELSRYASTWAAKMAQSGTLTRGYRGDVGSNTKIECDGTQDDGIQVVDSWYKDVCNYDFNTHQPVIGLFSQLVWKSSTSLGIGRSRGNYRGFACTYWVAVYKPPGNYEISREWNVDKGSFDWNAVCNPDSGQTTAPPPVTAAPVPVTSTAATPETAPPTPPATGAPPEVTTTPTPPVTTQQADNYQEYQLDALNRHNYYRSIHNAPAMQLDKELSRYASTWAAKMAQSGTLTRGYRGDVGSNTKIECDGTQDDGIQVVDSWYKDVCNYDFNAHQPVIGLFSQLVWKSSTSLGIGRSRGNYRGFACTYWVAVYKPPGNYEISREWNVDRGRFDWNAVCNPYSGQTTASPPVTAVPAPVTTTPAVVTTTSTSNSQDFQVNALNRHNYYRHIHNAPPMQLDKELSGYASAWAAKMARSHMIRTNRRGHLGQNVAVACDDRQADGIDVVDRWYKDVCNYNFNSHQPVGLFSQLVWKSSTHLGIGRSHGMFGGFDCTYWAAYYKPTGNMIGTEKWNVDKGSFDRNAVCKDMPV